MGMGEWWHGDTFPTKYVEMILKNRQLFHSATIFCMLIFVARFCWSWNAAIGAFNPGFHLVPRLCQAGEYRPHNREWIKNQELIGGSTLYVFMCVIGENRQSENDFPLNFIHFPHEFYGNFLGYTYMARRKNLGPSKGTTDSQMVELRLEFGCKPPWKLIWYDFYFHKFPWPTWSTVDSVDADSYIQRLNSDVLPFLKSSSRTILIQPISHYLLTNKTWSKSVILSLAETVLTTQEVHETRPTKLPG